MVKKCYFYTSNAFADFIRGECEILRKEAGINISTADMSHLLMENVIRPNNVRLSELIKPVKVSLKKIEPINVDFKWKKIKV